MSTWGLTDQLEAELDMRDGDEVPPDSVKSGEWFNPKFKPEARDTAAVTLANAWETHMRKLSYGLLNTGPWLSELEHEFGEGISPEMASSLMSMFVWFGTGTGFGTLHHSFVGKIVTNEYGSMGRNATIHLYGYWTNEFFGDNQQEDRRHLSSIMATEFTVEHFGYFVKLLDFLSSPRGAKLLNDALVKGGKRLAITIRVPVQIWKLELVKKDAELEHVAVYALERKTLMGRYGKKKRLALPFQVDADRKSVV